MKILIVLTSHDQLGNTGRKTGFCLEELAALYYAFGDAGAEIVLASPMGGQPPLDPKSNEPDFQTDLTHRFEADAQRPRRQTLPLLCGWIRYRRRTSTRCSIPALARCGIWQRTSTRSR